MGAIVTTLGELYASMMRASEPSDDALPSMTVCAFGREKFYENICLRSGGGVDHKESKQSKRSKEPASELPQELPVFPSPSPVSLRPRAMSGSSWDGAESPSGSRAPSPRPPLANSCASCGGRLDTEDEDTRMIRPYGSPTGEWVCSEACWRSVVAGFTKQNAEEDEGRQQLDVALDGGGGVGGHRANGRRKRGQGSTAAAPYSWVAGAPQESCSKGSKSRQEEEAKQRVQIWREGIEGEEGELELVVIDGCLEN
jgi:hypothetical protein